MKTITLKKLFIPKAETPANIQAKLTGDMELNYRELLLEYARAPMGGSQGVGVDDMRKAIRVLDKLEPANGSVSLEDADWEWLNARVQAAQFAFAHVALIEFVDAVANAPTDTA